jgi:glycosyltransferase involved in cell wall biosynthesis
LKIAILSDQHFPGRGADTEVLVDTAAGRPTVAADQAINTELLGEGENALLYQPGDDDRAAAAVQSLLNDPERSERLAKTARVTAEQHTWENRARIMLSFFERRLKALSRGRS